ncbi:MAG TPA: 50S ribosomal protein L16 [Candidatus Paceibacterota bacterium]|jgi:large subunit ribosomal protein L16|nr:50S ribosomal protein L16 [Candidatus Paceibacterota bacterium]HOQ15408.1 50S ribosomal protein L16 [Candidatus Paceibacterota bacterium]HPQ22808.1 50S ribosomal protein L16 [Candidatus Paceibacterota bacterium]HRR45555.1 50S ribosomal protein L16 [Candidatus Paceibacterota bacterium]
MLLPKKVKYRKSQKGRNTRRQKESRGTELSFGSYGLKSLEEKWITSRELEAAYRAIGRCLQKEGKSWMRVFPDKPITKRPPEVTMGGGKGAVEYYVVPVKPGRILFEIDGISPEKAKEAFRLASSKLSIKTKIVQRES